MPVLYHASSRVFANAMAGNAAAGTIDVARGRGEFGCGFYSQKSSSNAARRGHTLYGSGGAILLLTINEGAYRSIELQAVDVKHGSSAQRAAPEQQLAEYLHNCSRCNSRPDGVSAEIRAAEVPKCERTDSVKWTADPTNCEIGRIGGC
jgi:hypothetical protein